MNRALPVITLLIGGAAGYFIGKMGAGDKMGTAAEPGHAAVKKNSAVTPPADGSHSAPVKGGDNSKNQLPPPPGEEMPETVQIDRKLAGRCWAPPIIDYNTGKFDLGYFILQGLPLEEAQKLREKVNAAVKSVIDVQVKNARLISEGGEQFFRIEGYGASTASLKSRLEADIRTAFASFPDQRGELVAEKFLQATVFGGWGEDRIELGLVEKEKDGMPAFSLHLRHRSGNATDSMGFPVDGNYLADLYKALLKEHAP